MAKAKNAPLPCASHVLPLSQPVRMTVSPSAPKHFLPPEFTICPFDKCCLHGQKKKANKLCYVVRLFKTEIRKPTIVGTLQNSVSCLEVHTSGEDATARDHHRLLWQRCTAPRLHRPPQSPLCLGTCRNINHQQAHTDTGNEMQAPSATVKHISSVAVMPLTNMKDGFSAAVRALVACAQSKTNEQTLQTFM